MRIIAGALGNRNFASPHGRRTRPMSEKARGALFNTLGDISGLTILDAFAGSGAIAYEAISRGASHVTAIDSDKAAQVAIAGNINTLGLVNKVKLIKANANSWLTTTNDMFDIVVCDPPYDDTQPKLLAKLAERAKPSGIVVLSLPPESNFRLNHNYELLTQKNHGDATLGFYRRLG